MKKNYRVTIEKGHDTDSFTLLGKSKAAVMELCRIVHIGTGWHVKSVDLAVKKEKSCKPSSRQLLLF